MTIVEDRPAAGYDAARKAMIDSQLRTSGINTPFVLRRMAEVERERFVPEALRNLAYIDRALPLDGGKSLAAPQVQGLMLQEALPKTTDRVLVVDGGSGYLAELLRSLVASVEVIDAAAGALGKAQGTNFTLLVIDGAVEQVPASLAALLAPEGRIVTGLIRDGVSGVAVGRVANGAAALFPVAEIGVPPLPEFAAPKTWSF